jgi:hypothetical protein
MYHHDNNRVIQRSIGVEYIYLGQIRKQTDFKHIET